ncbi:Cyclodextrin-binding protein precursor [Paenibacillus konkukensis]|uniref:Cyclodextrin-binding protein n=1 Tax=Paenibacillus konkukensis TaxID=2020716 RepID=A0ABY4RHL0_9BACL|nr:sugar ABC transporter substrate-binding protein [Paenibacillus konkukensis]UQZ81109.1 Cyclodextrin-binding protein precursor [Paenibacillus konkukensis]
MGLGMVKSIALLLMLVFFTAVTACANTQFQTGRMPSVGHAEKEKVRMVMYDWMRERNPITDIYSEVVAEFNAREDVHASMSVRHIPGTPYYAKLNAGIAANHGPDLFMSHAAGVLGKYAAADRLLSLDDAFAVDPKWKESFNPGVLDLLSYRDKIYAVPSSFAVVALFYNKHIFEQHSLVPPRTYEQLLSVVRVLAANGVTPLAFGAKTPWTAAQFSEMVANRIGGNEPYDAIMEGRGSWLHPSFIETGHVMQQLRDNGAFPQSFLELDNDAVNLMFKQGQAAMLVTGSWAINQMIADDSKIKDSVGVIPFPAFPNGKGDMDTWLGQTSVNFAVNAEAKDQAAAIELLKMFTGEKYQRKIAEKGGDIPVIKLELDPGLTPQLTQALQEQLTGMKRLFIFYDVGLGTVIGDEYNQTVQAILAGKPPEEAFANLETFTNLHRGN